MIPMNSTLKLVVALALVGGVGALKALSVAMPAWTSWAGAVVQVLTVAEVFFTVPPVAAKQVAK